MNAFMTPSGLAKVRDEAEAHRAYLAQLREQRATDATKNLLSRAAGKQLDRRFTGEPLTGFGALSDERRAEIRAEEHADQLRDELRGDFYGDEE